MEGSAFPYRVWNEGAWEEYLRLYGRLVASGDVSSLESPDAAYLYVAELTAQDRVRERRRIDDAGPRPHGRPEGTRGRHRA